MNGINEETIITVVLNTAKDRKGPQRTAKDRTGPQRTPERPQRTSQDHTFVHFCLATRKGE